MGSKAGGTQTRALHAGHASSTAPMLARAAQNETLGRILTTAKDSFQKIQNATEYAQPYLTKLFQYGFIPLILLLGWRSEPRLKLSDFVMPM